jgi:hypothetical protein
MARFLPSLRAESISQRNNSKSQSGLQTAMDISTAGHQQKSAGCLVLGLRATQPVMRLIGQEPDDILRRRTIADIYRFIPNPSKLPDASAASVHALTTTPLQNHAKVTWTVNTASLEQPWFSAQPEFAPAGKHQSRSASTSARVQLSPERFR